MRWDGEIEAKLSKPTHYVPAPSTPSMYYVGNSYTDRLESYYWILLDCSHTVLQYFLKIVYDRTILENNLTVSYHFQHILPIYPSNSTPVYYPRKRNIYFHTEMLSECFIKKKISRTAKNWEYPNVHDCMDKHKNIPSICYYSAIKRKTNY